MSLLDYLKHETEAKRGKILPFSTCTYVEEKEEIGYYTPTQRVAGGVMFLTRPLFSHSVRQFCFSCQRSSETAQQNFPETLKL